ncbi:hypothetical protein [uncultured Xanthomonas sp.]|uniref:ATP-grasp domain-containing protein n=1 Tax=uncultured Xanthomonas sp. TaxID=152831 RepID=UPI0025D5CF1F|nr:hypothetical protein [uncultured Xanthomonas sp.]
MTSKILIVSSEEEDTHAKVVAWSLIEKGHEVTFWDTSKAIQTSGYSVEVGNNFPLTIEVNSQKNFDSAWLRRVFWPRNFSIATDAADKDYISGENKRYIDNTLECLSGNGIKWLNDKTSCISGELKIKQLHACQKLGIRFPDTLISSDASKIRNFVAKRGAVAVKPLDVYTWNQSDGSRLMTYTNVITNAELNSISDDELLSCPAIYQELIDKNLELRVVAVGGEVFSCSIKNSNTECIDFRFYQTDESLVYSSFETPPRLKEDILKLTHFFGLQMVSSDFCVDKDGNIFFLDLNPGGAFLFVEYWGGSRIVASVAALLGGGAPSEYKSLADYNLMAEEENKVTGA